MSARVRTVIYAVLVGALVVPAGAEALLTYSHPTLTAEQRRQILASTAIDSGYPLDQGRTAADSGWTRIDLATALGAA